MGARGRDILLIFLAFALLTTLIAVATGAQLCCQVSMAAAICFGLWWLKLNLYDIRKARQESARRGFEVIILLPLSVRWAKLLAGKKFKKQLVAGAYEIHMRDSLPPPRQLITSLEKDLAYLNHNMQGLFLWETNITVPRRIRAKIKRYEELGRALWVSGGWPIPRLPTIKRASKKTLRRGTILIGGEPKS